MWTALLKHASNQQLALLPLLLPLYLLLRFLGNPLPIVQGWMTTHKADRDIPPPVGSQLLAYMIVGWCGYRATHALIPNIKVRFMDVCARNVIYIYI